MGVGWVGGRAGEHCSPAAPTCRRPPPQLLLPAPLDSSAHSPTPTPPRAPPPPRADEGNDNPHARDALATIEGRIRGTLLGVSSQPCMPLSAEGQAHRLIEEATDKENLGMMYIW